MHCKDDDEAPEHPPRRRDTPLGKAAAILLWLLIRVAAALILWSVEHWLLPWCVATRHPTRRRVPLRPAALLPAGLPAISFVLSSSCGAGPLVLHAGTYYSRLPHVWQGVLCLNFEHPFPTLSKQG